MHPSPKLALITTTILLLMLAIIAQIAVFSGEDAAAAQQATPTLGFGPVIGSDYASPTPQATPIPSDLHPPACYATVLAAELPIHSEPNAQSAQTGTVYTQNRLPITALHTTATSDQWGATSNGWLPLTQNQTTHAQLDAVRACELLNTNRPLKSTSFGLHLVNSTGAAEIMSLVQRLQANGITLGTIKGINGTEQLLNSVKSASPDTIVVYRSLYATNSVGDCPNLDGIDPSNVAAFTIVAERWITGLEPIWRGVNADYYELMNECGGTLEQQTLFSIEAMKFANAQSRCLLLYAFSAGQPQIEEATILLPAIEYAAQNPCQPGRYHGIAVHNYGVEGDTLLSEASEWLALRHRKLYTELVTRFPPTVNIPFFITEAGPGGGGGFMNTPRCEDMIVDVVQYSHQLEQDPYVWGFHEWSFGAGTVWWDLTPCLEGIGSALIGYYGGPTP